MTRQILLGLALALLGACGGAPAVGADDVAIKMTDFVVPAGVEAYKCQNFANPFGGQAVDVSTFESHMPAGAHHMIVFFVDDLTDGGPEDCSGSEFHGNVFGAQVPDSVMEMPAGVGVAIAGRTGLRVQLHFLNATAHDITAGVTARFHVANPGSITQHAGQLIFSNQDISIPPTRDGKPAQVTKTCPMPAAVSLIGASAHVHRHATEFLATSEGRVLFHMDGALDPTPARFDPPVELRAQQGVTFTCSYRNDGPADLVFGESAATNEMCIFAGIYYPVSDLSFPNLPCF